MPRATAPPSSEHERKAPQRLAEFLRAERERILAAWEEAARKLPVTEGLDTQTLRNHLPHLLEEIEKAACTPEADGASLSSAGYPETHALERLSEGYDLEDVVHEYALLRELALTRWMESGLGTAGGLLLNRALDEAVRAAVVRFHASHERTLRALDEISAAALRSTDEVEALRALAEALRETTESADTVLLYVREGEAWRLEVATGLGTGAQEGATRQLGEGLAGRVALEGRPLEVRDAAHSDTVRNPALRSGGVRALYGIPMRVGAEILGVAQVGSCTAFEFSREDKALFGSMVERATAALVQHRLRRELDAERRRLRAVLDALPVGIFVADAQGRLQETNPEARRLWGETPLVGPEDYGEYRGWDVRTGRRLGAEDWALARVLATGEASPVQEVRIQAFDGQEHIVANRAVPIRDARGELLGVVTVNVDITERREAQEALQRSEQELRTLTEVMPQLVWTARADGQLDYVNPRLAAYLGERVGAFLASDWREVVHLEDLPAFEEVWAHAVATGEPFQVERRLRGADGTWRWFLTRGVAVRDEQGRVLRWLGTSTDIDDLKRAEAELRQRTEFEQQLIGIVSHDLRNPLNAILLSTQTLLRSEELTARQARIAARLFAVAERAARLTRDLLDFTRARLGGGIPVERRPLDFHALVQQVLEEVRAAHPERDVELRASGEGVGEWDEDRLAQVVTNLVNNALAYSPPDSPVRVETGGSAEHVSLSVHNEGRPIEPEVMPHLFEPMRRGAGGGGAPGSIGLGLFVVRSIVQAHGGHVDVRSTAEEGTTFRVVLPRRPS